jgi:hypothetical protein
VGDIDDGHKRVEGGLHRLVQGRQWSVSYARGHTWSIKRREGSFTGEAYKVVVNAGVAASCLLLFCVCVCVCECE